MGDLIAAYDEQHHVIPEVAPRELLAFFMQQQHLTPAGLVDIAPQSVISEVLSGKRLLNLNHIKVLSARFGVSPAVFI